VKILLVSNHNPHFMTNVEYMHKALGQAGHEVSFFDDRAYWIPGRLRQRFDALQAWDLGRLNGRMLQRAQGIGPDLCLVIGGYRILASTLRKFRRCGIRTALLTTDAPIDNFTSVVETAPLYDDVFCSGSEAIEILRGVHRLDPLWVPFACDPDYHRFQPLTPKEQARWGRDVAFVGSYYPNRWEILRELTGFDVGIWGPGWRRVSRQQQGLHIQEGQIRCQEWIKVYSAAKIVIVIHFQDGRTPCYQASPKVYEALACRGFVLVDQQKDVENLFQSGKHLVVFSDVDDLKEKLRHYLQRDDLRMAIASEGCREVLEKHTYRHRIRKILDHVSEGGVS